MKDHSIGFKSCYHAEVVEPDTVILLTDKGNGIKLVGRSYVLLAKHLQEATKSKEEIVSLLQELIPKEEVYYALLRLQNKQIIEEKGGLLPKNIAAFCDLLNISTQAAYDRLLQMPISLHTVGEVSGSDFVKSCLALQIKVEKEGNIAVVLTDNYRNPKLEHFHKKSLQTQKPWLLICPFGPQIWLGPLLIPGKTACWLCLLHALKNYRIEETLIEDLQKREKPIGYHVADLPTAKGFAVNWAATELFKWIVEGKSVALENTITTFDFCTSQQVFHHVIKKTHCPSCGIAPKTAPEDISLEEDFKKDFSYEEIFERYAHLISPVSGIVAFMEKVSKNPSSVLHNYFAGFNLADLEFVRRFPIGQAVATASGGKGLTDAQAKASCLCEAIERYSGIFHRHEIRKEASFEELGTQAIHPYDLLLFSDKQYEIRQEWNRTCHHFHTIPNRFDETKKVDWTPVWSLTEGTWKWTPTSYCYFSYSQKKDGFCKADSNGCASGNTKLEAILAAFFELVERDSVAIWWYNQIQMPEVDLDKFYEPYIEKLQAHYQSEKRKFWVLDLTADLNIPVFAALSSDFSGKQILFGFGAHFDPKIALLRALTEMNQSYHVASWQRGLMMDANRKRWLEKTTLENSPYLTAAKPSKEHFYEKQTPSEALSKACSLLQEKGLEFLVLDQTHPDIGMPVFRVMVPGLRHFWNRYAPGRLYDVPVALGWIKEKKEESALNPIAMFI